MSDNFEIKLLPILNRGVVLMVGKQPFYDWVNSVFPDDTVQLEDFTEHNSYLITDNETFDDPKTTMKKYWKTIFEQELFGMCSDPDTFPKLTWPLFTQWFSCYYSSLVQDLEQKPLYLETYE